MENAVRNIETDVGANISSDHVPVVAKLRIKLKKKEETPEPRKKLVFTKPTEEERAAFDGKRRRTG